MNKNKHPIVYKQNSHCALVGQVLVEAEKAIPYQEIIRRAWAKNQYAGNLDRRFRNLRERLEAHGIAVREKVDGVSNYKLFWIDRRQINKAKELLGVR